MKFLKTGIWYKFSEESNDKKSVFKYHLNLDADFLLYLGPRAFYMSNG